MGRQSWINMLARSMVAKPEIATIDTPEKTLLIAVITRAMWDLKCYANPKSGSDQLIKRSATKFLFCDIPEDFIYTEFNEFSLPWMAKVLSDVPAVFMANVQKTASEMSWGKTKKLIYRVN